MRINKTALYSILTALLTGTFVFLILIGQQMIGFGSIWAGVIGALIITLIFQPLRDGIQAAVDRLFFRSRYDYQSILNKYGSTLTRPMSDLDRFSRIAPYLLWKSMKLADTSIMILDRANHCYLVRAGEGGGDGLVGRSIPEDSLLIREMIGRQKEIDGEEIGSALKTGDLAVEERKKLESILSEMAALKAVLMIPSLSESEYFNKPTLLATLNLGKKLSGEPYSREDVDFLKTLAGRAALNIEYAFIFEELKKNQAQVIKSEKLAALGTTVAGIAHELKNPLTYLLNVGQLMAASWDNPAFKDSVLKMLPSEVERMKLIIDGLSDYSKQHELKIEPVEMSGVIEKALAILGYEIKKNNVSVVKKFPAGKEAGILALADKYRIVQVFMNIIANAVQAMGEKGGDLSIAIRKNGNEVRIAIADTGPGIPADKLQRIFDPFYTTKETGTGLGLSITKKIIDEHKGSIDVDSRAGGGTTFTICLPAAA